MFIIYTSIYKRPNPIIYDHSTTEKESTVAGLCCLIVLFTVQRYEQ